MPQPKNYTPSTSFDAYSQSHPGDPLNGLELDQEFQAIQETTGEIIDNLGLLQRDDGRLKNLTVHADAFDATALRLMGGGWTPRGHWQVDTNYAVTDVVYEVTSGHTYVCVVEHLSGLQSSDFGAALGQGKWISLSDASITFDEQTQILNFAGKTVEGGTFSNANFSATVFNGANIAGGTINGATIGETTPVTVLASTIEAASVLGNVVSGAESIEAGSSGTEIAPAYRFAEYPDYGLYYSSGGLHMTAGGKSAIRAVPGDGSATSFVEVSGNSGYALLTTNEGADGDLRMQATGMGRLRLGDALHKWPDSQGVTGQFLTLSDAGAGEMAWVHIAGGGDMVRANNLNDVTDANAAANNILNGAGSVGVGTAAVGGYRVVQDGGWALTGTRGSDVPANAIAIDVAGVARINSNQIDIMFLTGQDSSEPQFAVTRSAGAVNYFSATGGSSGNPPRLIVTGPDAITNAAFMTKGDGGGLYFQNESYYTQGGFINTANAVNHLVVTGGATGNAPMIEARGNDSDVGLKLATKGAGTVYVGPLVPESSHHFEVNSGNDSAIGLRSSDAGAAVINFGKTSDYFCGRISYDNSGDSMTFWTDASEKVRIASDGNVGIGTASPDASLSIKGGGSTHAFINGGNSVVNGDTPLFATLNNEDIASATYGWLWYDNNSNGNLELYRRAGSTTGIQALTIERLTGQVGIGVSAPDAELHVVQKGSGQTTNGIRLTGTNNAHSSVFLTGNDGNTYLFSPSVDKQVKLMAGLSPSANLAHFVPGSASAVNYFTFTTSATGSNPINIVGAAGSDTNVGLGLSTKGSGNIMVGSSLSAVNNPSRKLQILSESSVKIQLGLQAFSNDNSSQAAMDFFSSNGSALGALGAHADASSNNMQYHATHAHEFYCNAGSFDAGSLCATFMANGDLRVGNGAALATNAVNGFLNIPGCAGTPTGTPVNSGAGSVSLVYDTANNILYAHDGGGWAAV